MSLGGLIPIGGATSGGSSKQSRADLTGGLISIGSGGSKAASTLHESDDFDVDSLLQDSVPTTSKSSSTAAKKSSSKSKDSSKKKSKVSPLTCYMLSKANLKHWVSIEKEERQTGFSI